MRWFYILTVVFVVVLGAMPFIMLPKNTDDFTGLSVIYDVYGSKIKSLDPATAGDVASAGLQANIFESLYTYHFLKRPIPGKVSWSDLIEPLLAESKPEISSDGLTYTIKLKKGVMYRPDACFGKDATGNLKTRELKAQDFVLGFKRIADYHINTDLALAFLEDKIAGIGDYRAKTQAYDKGDFSRYDKEDISGIKALDDYTLQLKLTVPFPQMIFVLAMPNYVPIPRELIDYYLCGELTDDKWSPLPMEKRSPEINNFKAMVGTGPYYLDQYVDGGKIVMKRNKSFRPDFYPTEGAPGDKQAGLLDDAGKRLPLVDVIYQEFVPESFPMWQLFRTRQVDVAGIPMQMFQTVITTKKELDPDMAAEGITLMKYTSPAVYWFTLNMDDKVLGASKSLRQAMNLGFSVEDYLRVLRNDRGIRATNVVPTSFTGHAEAGPGPYAHYSKQEAIAKLQDAKKELVAAGIIKEGEPIPALTLDLGSTDEETRKLGEFTQQQYKEIGLEIKINLQDWPTLLSKMRLKQCQIYSSGWHADYPDAENFLQLFYSPNMKRGTNNSNYSNPEFDKLYEKVIVMPDSKERTDLYVKMINMLSEDCPVVFQTEPENFLLIHPWVHNVKPSPIAYGTAKYRRIDAVARQKAGGR